MNLALMLVWLWRGISPLNGGFVLLALVAGLVALADLLPAQHRRLRGRIRISAAVLGVGVVFGGIIWIGLTR
jgi:hypothetical protein